MAYGFGYGAELPVHPERRGIYAQALHLRYLVAQVYSDLGQHARAECVLAIADAMEEYALQRE
jgi:hypothetical protein